MDIEQHILNLINEIGDIDSTTHLNERYLHHLFSHRIQQDYPLSLDYHSKLPPEWATNVYRNKKYIQIYKCKQQGTIKNYQEWS